ncbi:MAG TPA: nicotinamide-nucleotide amidohydrolase family protein [Gallionellaceae bacterium]|nr:nicotinamide-nucleotide amidohydrolase family protein [Gallionellaceae bacterium]
MNQLAAQVGAALQSHGMMMATAESCTGGGVACAVTEIAGSSAWFDRGFVTYSNQAKIDMLGVSPDTLSRFGAVSEATVREMVEGTLRHSQAQLALAVSGIAGPGGGTADKPVGTVWFAWGTKDGVNAARLHRLVGNRAEIRLQAVRIALQGVLELLDHRIETA